MTIKILIADDHPSFRRVLGTVLSDTPDLEVIGEASNGQEAIEKIGELKPDVVLMDLRMPEINGVKATAAIREKFPEVKVIVLTLFDEADDLFNAVKAGAKGYLLKSVELDGLVASIRYIASGEVIVPPVMASRILNDFKSGSRRRSPVEAVTLTDREKQVLQLVAQGLKEPEVAAKVSITEADVRTDLRNALEKFQRKYQGK